jgi:hypothetical protein
VATITPGWRLGETVLTAILTVLIPAIVGALIAKFTDLSIDGVRKRFTKVAPTKLVGWMHVQSWHWNGEDLLKRLIALDRQVLGNDANDTREGTARQWAPVFVDHPNTWKLLISGPKKIIGYWHFVTLTDEAFARIRAGKLSDSEIGNDLIASIDTPGVYNMYVSMFGTLPAYRHERLRLINSFVAAIEHLALNGVFFREICANAFTPDGRYFCERMDMAALCEHADYGRIFGLTLVPWPTTLRRWRCLDHVEELYRERFGHAPGGRPRGTRAKKPNRKPA